MNESAREWIGMSDLMTGLMLVFLFLAVLFMVKSEEESAEATRRSEDLAQTNDDLGRANAILGAIRDRADGFATSHNRYRDRLHQDLNAEFEHDLADWNAVILSDNTIQFRGPEVLFERGSHETTPKFEGILSNFFPRYVRVLVRAEYKDNINEIRIVGHTSSEWESAGSFEDRYLMNMGLSQTRAFSVLEYCIGLDIGEKKWLGRVLRANGLAFAKPIRIRGKERPARSRRVEFKVLMKIEENVEHLLEDLEALKND